MKKSLTIGAALLWIGASALQAQVASPDQKFVREAAMGGAAEVELGKMAAEKASSQKVKAFGQRMADDHAKAGDQLTRLAQGKHITVSTELDPKDKALRDRLTGLRGADFDRAYMDAMVKDHEADISAFATESRSGGDPEIKAWASKTLPTLEEHLRLARDADRAVGTSGRK